MYKTKYEFGFFSVLKEKYKVFLKQKGYTDNTIYSLLGGQSPVILQDAHDGDEVDIPVRGVNTQLNIVTRVDNSEYNLIQDLSNVSEKEWQAHVVKVKEQQAYKGVVGIDTLSLTNSSTPAHGDFTITEVGSGLQFEPVCRMKLEIYALPESQTTLNIYAVPVNEGNQYNGRILVRTIPVYYSDNQTTIINRICESPQFTLVTGTYDVVEYTQTTFSFYIDSGWNLKPEYLEEIQAYGTSNNYHFSGSTQNEWLDVRLRIKRFGEAPSSYLLARHYWHDNETISEVAVDLALQITENQDIENVYFPSVDAYLDLHIAPVPTGGQVQLWLYGIGEVGNGIQIVSTELDDTYFQIVKSADSSYDWTSNDCAGGDSKGDTFTIEINKNNTGWNPFVSIEAENNDTIELLISKLNAAIFQTQVNYISEIDSEDVSRVNFQTELDMSDCVYRFTTSGGSTLYDAGLNFEVIDSEETVSISWVIPGLMQFTRINGIQPISIDTVSGLGDLRNEYFSTDIYIPYGKLSLLNILVLILRKTGFNFYLYEAFDLWEVYMDTTKSPLLQVYKDTALLNGRDCYSILEEILEILDATITQENGTWRLIPLTRESEIVKYRVFDYLGRYVGEKEINYRVTIGSNVRYIGGNATQQFNTPVSKVIFTQEYGFVSQLIKFPKFSNFNENINAENYNADYPWKWELEDVPQTAHVGKLNRTESGILIIQDSSGQADPFALSQKIVISRVEKADAEKPEYELKIEYIAVQGQILPSDKIEIEVIQIETAGKSWLTPSGYWSFLSQQVLTIPTKEASGVSTASFGFGYNPFSIQENNECELQVKIQQPKEGYIQIKSVNIEVNMLADSEKKQAMYFTDINSSGDTYYKTLSSNILEKTMKTIDVPDIPNAKTIYKNALYRIVGNSVFISKGWKTKEGQEVELLSDIIQKRTLKRRGVYGIKIQATVRGKQTLRSILYDYIGIQLSKLVEAENKMVLTNLLKQIILKPNTPPCKLMLTGGSLDLRQNTLQGEWVQIDLENTTNYFPQTIWKEIIQTEQSTGSDTYTGNTGGSTFSGITQEQVLQMLQGVTGSFLGSDLDSSRKITIIHNLNRASVLFLLYKDGDYITATNYKLTTEQTNTKIVLTLSIPYQSGTEFKYRII